MRRWTTATSRTVFDHPLLALDERSVEAAPDQRQVIVLRAPDWVNVIPLTPDDRVLLVRQWRFGLEDFTLEIPGGVVEPDESPREAGARELLEETGWRAGRMEEVGWVHPNPAIFDNRCWTFVARELEEVGPAAGDGFEELELVAVERSALPRFVREGRIRHSLVIAAFHQWGLGAA